MKTKLSRYLFVVALLGTTVSLHAIAGVMDFVIIQEDISWYKTKYSFFESHLNSIEGYLSRLAVDSKENLKRLGQDAQSAPEISNLVPDVKAPTEAVASLESRAQCEEKGLGEYSIEKKHKAPVQASKKVESSTTVLGTKEARNTKRYDAFALQEALNARQAKALENEEKVAAKEYQAQTRLQERLQKAKTAAEVQAVQTSLTASQHRLLLARQKVEQAKEDCALLRSELSVEDGKKKEADREWEERFVEKLRARALTALHAQKGENS